MIIEIDKIPEQGLHFSVEEPAEVLGLADDSIFSAKSPVRCELYVQVVSDTLIVRGTVSAEVQVRCVRCAQMFSTTVTDSGFLRDYSEITETEELDITEDLRETVILNLPQFPLCDEECKGLCPQCGKELNQGSCDCLNGEDDGAWEALDNLNL